jgi:hypothetical protein
VLLSFLYPAGGRTGLQNKVRGTSATAMSAGSLLYSSLLERTVPVPYQVAYQYHTRSSVECVNHFLNMEHGHHGHHHGHYGHKKSTSRCLSEQAAHQLSITFILNLSHNQLSEARCQPQRDVFGCRTTTACRRALL